MYILQKPFVNSYPTGDVGKGVLCLFWFLYFIRGLDNLVMILITIIYWQKETVTGNLLI